MPCYLLRVALRPRHGVLLAGALSVLATVSVALLPGRHFAYRSLSLHVALETCIALIGLLNAWLVLGRFRRSRLGSDLVLAVALALLGLTNLAFRAFPAAVWAARAPTDWTWAAMTAAVAGTSVFAVAPYIARTRAGHMLPTVAVAAVPLFLVVVAVSYHYLPALPRGVDPRLAPSPRPFEAGAPIVAGAQLLLAILHVVAAVGFVRWAEREHDRLIGWFAAGATVAAAARLNYFLFPSIYSQWVYTGDVLRLAAYLLLLAGAAAEIRGYERAHAAIAVVEERRRLARDLHDGLAQELAFIARETRRSETSPEIGTAAERALDEARRAIAALSASREEPLDEALAQAAEEVATRVGAAVRLRLAPGVEVAPAAREALVRIVREAVANAGRHATAGLVLVELTNGAGTRVRVVDDGTGFDPAHVRPGGFGLVSMRERAEALGGRFRVASGEWGTEVEVLLP